MRDHRKTGAPRNRDADARFGLRGCGGRHGKFCALILATIALLAISLPAATGDEAGRLDEVSTYAVANQLGAESEPWHPDGDWVLGSLKNDASVVSIKISSTDGGPRRSSVSFCRAVSGATPSLLSN